MEMGTGGFSNKGTKRPFLAALLSHGRGGLGHRGEQRGSREASRKPARNMREEMELDRCQAALKVQATLKSDLKGIF